jgi:hypothetical protein
MTLLPRCWSWRLPPCPISLSVAGRDALAWFAGGTGLLAILWLIAKQVAHIDSPSQFITLGLAERVVMTQLLFLAGWLAMRRATDWSPASGPRRVWPRPRWRCSGCAGSTWASSIRFTEAQSLGPAPVANLGTDPSWDCRLLAVANGAQPVVAKAHPQLPKLAEIGSLLAMALTALVTVRQLVHGNLISGATIDVGENYLYSAALLALSIIWLPLVSKPASPSSALPGWRC